MLLRIYRLARWSYLHHIPVLPRLLKAVIYLVFNCVLPPECVIGRGTKLWHNGLGIMIHPSVEIGENCNIYNFSAIGGGYDGPQGPPIRIVIGNSVNIGNGAKVLCKAGVLRIGDGSTVGSNSVVLSDVPPQSIAVGIPAQIHPKQKIRRELAPTLEA